MVTAATAAVVAVVVVAAPPPPAAVVVAVVVEVDVVPLILFLYCQSLSIHIISHFLSSDQNLKK